MRMAILTESGIQFDFGDTRVIVPYDPNRLEDEMDSAHPWKNIDFRIQISENEWIWLEVKCLPNNIPPEHRQKQEEHFLEKLNSGQLVSELRNKFLGTTAYLSWSKEFHLVKTHYICLLEAPGVLNIAHLKTLNDQLSRDIPNLGWAVELSTIVLDLKLWNKRFSHFKAQKLIT